MHDSLETQAELGARRRALLAELVRGGLPGERRNVRTRIDRRSHHPVQADPQSDAELRERIQQRLGRMVSHPRAIAVDVHEGVVRLSGRVLAQEREGLLRQVQEMPGVRRLVNDMSAHRDPRELASRGPLPAGSA
jgi:hypothetical protein